ncbi:MAG: hypothetical protein AB7O55_30955 [Lautropia sp.]
MTLGLIVAALLFGYAMYRNAHSSPREGADRSDGAASARDPEHPGDPDPGPPDGSHGEDGGGGTADGGAGAAGSGDGD